ncbi:transposase [Paenibacillus alba]|uniref:transposase n=1 Tax=Paenibacillus alba TaxID=1197127 RepID=UPI001FE85E33|nr:transposase [Paenibacillus alba]
MIQALNGRVQLHHRWMIGRHLEHLNQVEEHIEILNQEIDKLIGPYKEEIDLLITIPGVQKDAAASILAEIGTDMSVFPSEDHIASWAAVCPESNESAGKKRSSKTNKGNKGLSGMGFFHDQKHATSCLL